MYPTVRRSFVHRTLLKAVKPHYPLHILYWGFCCAEYDVKFLKLQITRITSITVSCP